MANVNRQWVLAKRPHGKVGPANFEYREGRIPKPRDGQVLVRNIYLSFDPTQRGWLARDTYGTADVGSAKYGSRGVPFELADLKKAIAAGTANEMGDGIDRWWNIKVSNGRVVSLIEEYQD